MAPFTEHPAFWPSYQAALTALLTKDPALVSHNSEAAKEACRNAYITAEECVSALKAASWMWMEDDDE